MLLYDTNGALIPETPKIIAHGSAVLGTVEQSVGRRLTPKFKDQLTVYNEDPDIKESINQFAEQVISNGFYTVMNEDYKVTRKKPKGGGRWTAKECIDAWNKANNLDAKILKIAIELFGFGNSFWQIIDKIGLSNIPIESVDEAAPKKKEVSVRDKYDLKLTAEYRSKTVPMAEYIHFKTNTTGTAPFGTGVLYTLITIPANTPSLYQVRQAVRKAMKTGFEKFSFGNNVYSFKDLDQENFETIAALIKDMPATGQRIVVNTEASIISEVPARTTTYDMWLTMVQNEFYMALANPSLKLGLEQGFTKATAEAALSMFEAKIESFRREIKRQIEALYVQVLKFYGFDGEKAEITLYFGSDEVEYDSADLFKSVELGLVTKDEARNILRTNMKWELPTETLEEEPVEEVVREGQETTEETLEEWQLKNEKERNAMLHAIIKANGGAE